MRVLILAFALATSIVPARAATYYIAPAGNDAWSGTLPAANKGKSDGPFASLERARDEIRKLKKAGPLPRGGVTIELRGGNYHLSKSFSLNEEDSGQLDAPIIYRAYRNEVVRLTGGKNIGDWKLVTDKGVLPRLDESARSKIRQTDLRAQGINDFGQMTSRGFGRPIHEAGLELFFDDKPMTLARWPNVGFTTIEDAPAGKDGGLFSYSGDRPKRWVNESDIWLHGYWTFDWADSYEKVAAIDIEKRSFATTAPHSIYGYTKGGRYYALNLLSELDAPGEWYLDRAKGVLYFWPPAPLNQNQAVVSLSSNLISTKNTSYVSFKNFTFEATRGTAIKIEGGAHNAVIGCTLRNIGNLAVDIQGGTNSGVAGSDIYETGDGGISIDGGNRTTLTPANHYAINNHIHDYSRWSRTYRPAVFIDGVGNRVAHNLIHDAPHNAIYWRGNDHVFEYNEIHNIAMETGDVGAFYTVRDWTARGTIVRHNYLHHISGPGRVGAMGVYFDDGASGMTVFGNVFYKVTQATYIGGGRDNLVENNIFVDCEPAVHVDARGVGWMRKTVEEENGDLRVMLRQVPYQNELWRARYPQLPNILEDEPGLPKNNLVARNINVGGQWDDIVEEAKPHVKFENNFLKGDPRFVNAARQNFQLRPDSPAWKLGFKPIPINEIGLVRDSTRASWPASHPVREMPKTISQMAAKTKAPLPVFAVVRATTSPNVDGIIEPSEWGTNAQNTMMIERGINHEIVQPRSRAKISFDKEYLYVAIAANVDPAKPLRKGVLWGQSDAVEIALRDTSKKDAPIFVLRGYPNGVFESSLEAGAPANQVRALQDATRYGARVVNASEWTTEWKIPFAALNIKPEKQTKLAFNITVHQSAASAWQMWQGTGGNSWLVEKAGFIQFAR